MATKKKSEKKHITVKQANALIDKYYALKNALYKIETNEKMYDSVRKAAKSANKALQRWRGNSLDLNTMSGYRVG